MKLFLLILLLVPSEQPAVAQLVRGLVGELGLVNAVKLDLARRRYNHSCIYHAGELLICNTYDEYHHCDDDSMCKSNICWGNRCNDARVRRCYPGECKKSYYCKLDKRPGRGNCVTKKSSGNACVRDFECMSESCKFLECG